MVSKQGWSMGFGYHVTVPKQTGLYGVTSKVEVMSSKTDKTIGKKVLRKEDHHSMCPRPHLGGIKDGLGSLEEGMSDVKSMHDDLHSIIDAMVNLQEEVNVT